MKTEIEEIAVKKHYGDVEIVENNVFKHRNCDIARPFSETGRQLKIDHPLVPEPVEDLIEINERAVYRARVKRAYKETFKVKLVLFVEYIAGIIFEIKEYVKSKTR